MTRTLQKNRQSKTNPRRLHTKKKEVKWPDVADRLQTLMYTKNFKISDLMKLTEKSRSGLRNYIRGERRLPFDVAESISYALETTPEFILYGTPEDEEGLFDNEESVSENRKNKSGRAIFTPEEKLICRAAIKSLPKSPGKNILLAFVGPYIEGKM
jgi:hypothetical protein